MKIMIFNINNLNFFLGRMRSWFRSLFFDVYCFLAKLFRLKINEGKIVVGRLYFEVTNICNARCRFCVYSKKNPDKYGTMPFEIFKKAADEFNGMGGGGISFTPTIGEPLLDPGLIDKVKYSLSLPNIKKVYFYTNGILLGKDDNYKKLIDSGITEIEISIAAFDKEIHKKIHQIDVYEQTLDGIHKLLQYNDSQGRKTKIGINFRSPVLPSVVLGGEDFKKYIKPFLGNDVSYSFLSTYDNWCGNITNKDLYGIMKMRRIVHFQYLPCVRMSDAMVLFDGSIRLCACRIKDSEFDELVIGNIKNQSLKEIIFSSKAQELRNSFVDGKIPVTCKNCSLYAPNKN
ncbi:MAG: radical SAM protein [Dehalococcoidales bacterium]|jgi:radical SAM protein with 4Fe4S-binding SPASM domain|nr:radical SAM protein [Dehalococcoidales bacterium]